MYTFKGFVTDISQDSYLIGYLMAIIWKTALMAIIMTII